MTNMIRTSFTFLAALAVAILAPAVQAGTITYFHNDLAGSALAATNEQGLVVWRESYRPYGERLVNSPAASGNSVWFTSRRQDAESGLVYMGARHYDPVAGRFVSVDPVGFDEGNVHSFNRYAYANNNPYRYKDPDGRMAETISDVISFGISVEMFRRDPSVGNFLGAAFDGVMMVVPFAPGGVGSIRALGKGAEAATEAAKNAGKFEGVPTKVFSKEKQALVEMAKGDKKTGMTPGDMQAYKDLNRQLPDPFPSNKVRGPEEHSSGAPSSVRAHGHVGPVDHIPIRDPK